MLAPPICIVSRAAIDTGILAIAAAYRELRLEPVIRFDLTYAQTVAVRV